MGNIVIELDEELYKIWNEPVNRGRWRLRMKIYIYIYRKREREIAIFPKACVASVCS